MSLTVGDLLEALAALPADRLVVMSKDAEGNGFSPLDEINEQSPYLAETTWSGDVLGDDDDHPDAVPAVVLWPVN